MNNEEFNSFVNYIVENILLQDEELIENLVVKEE